MLRNSVASNTCRIFERLGLLFIGSPLFEHFPVSVIRCENRLRVWHWPPSHKQQLNTAELASAAPQQLTKISEATHWAPSAWIEYACRSHRTLHLPRQARSPQSESPLLRRGAGPCGP